MRIGIVAALLFCSVKLSAQPFDNTAINEFATTINTLIETSKSDFKNIADPPPFLGSSDLSFKAWSHIEGNYYVARKYYRDDEALSQGYESIKQLLDSCLTATGRRVTSVMDRGTFTFSVIGLKAADKNMVYDLKFDLSAGNYGQAYVAVLVRRDSSVLTTALPEPAKKVTAAKPIVKKTGIDSFAVLKNTLNTLVAASANNFKGIASEQPFLDFKENRLTKHEGGEEYYFFARKYYKSSEEMQLGSLSLAVQVKLALEGKGKLENKGGAYIYTIPNLKATDKSKLYDLEIKVESMSYSDYYVWVFVTRKWIEPVKPGDEPLIAGPDGLPLLRTLKNAREVSRSIMKLVEERLGKNKVKRTGIESSDLRTLSSDRFSLSNPTIRSLSEKQDYVLVFMGNGLNDVYFKNRDNNGDLSDVTIKKTEWPVYSSSSEYKMIIYEVRTSRFVTLAMYPIGKTDKAFTGECVMYSFTPYQLRVMADDE